MTVTIASLDVFVVTLDLVEPLVTAAGVHRARDIVLVRTELSDGTLGWGENVAPQEAFYTGESSESSRRHLEDVLAPVALGVDVTDPLAFEQRLAHDEFPMARHALSSAVWDARCHGQNMALAHALGGMVRPVRVCAVVGLGASPADTAAGCEALVAEGYSHLKIKIAPGHDCDVVAAVRDLIGDDVTLSVDANGAYGSDDVEHLIGLSRWNVALVEQPFAPGDLATHRALTSTGALGVGLDESVMDRDDLGRVVDAQACTAVNIKPARVGGFGAAVIMAEMCRAEGIDAWVGGMLESGIGRAGALALATHPGFTLPADLSASARYFVHDVTEPFVLVDGCLVPRSPGIGVVPSDGCLYGAD